MATAMVWTWAVQGVGLRGVLVDSLFWGILFNLFLELPAPDGPGLIVQVSSTMGDI